jgi:hypothetical protein
MRDDKSVRPKLHIEGVACGTVAPIPTTSNVLAGSGISSPGQHAGDVVGEAGIYRACTEWRTGRWEPV